MASSRALLVALCPLFGGALACDSGDLVAAASTEGPIRPLVTVTIPGAASEPWDLSDPGLEVSTAKGRPLLYIAQGDEALSFTCPIPEEALGATHISLRVGSDGPFEFALDLDDRTSHPMKMGNTRRQWRELVFTLDDLLSRDEVGRTMRIVRVASERPVLFEAIRFLP